MSDENFGIENSKNLQNMKTLQRLLLVALLLIVNCSLSIAQCAMCRATVESSASNGRGSIGSGLNTGILYMLSAPYILVALIGYLWYRNSKSELAKRIALRSRLRQVFFNGQ
jgi:hypothetical protein